MPGASRCLVTQTSPNTVDGQDPGSYPSTVLGLV